MGSSISIFLFLLINTSLEIYGLSIKNFCLILSCGLTRLCLIAFGNLAVIILAFFVDAMEKDQLTYLSVGVPICIYNFIKAITLFKAAHRIRKKEKEELEFKRRNYHYSRQISIQRPDYNCQDRHHQNTMQYTQPTLYSVSVPQSAEFY